ncbi:amino acid ABC transporter permease [Arthrobacter sp. D2-10]
MNIDWTLYIESLGQALLNTLAFTVVSFLGSVLLGIILALLRGSSKWPFRASALGYTEVLKNLPLITTIYIFYFGLPSVGIRLDVFTAGVLSLVLAYGAYMSEVFRGGLEGVQKGQREASLALGLTPRAVETLVILPQAIRLALPGTGTMLVDLLKSTALLVTIGGAELMTQGQIIASTTFRPLEVYVMIGALYFALCFPLSRLVGALERRLEASKPMSARRVRRLHAAERLLAERRLQQDSNRKVVL